MVTRLIILNFIGLVYLIVHESAHLVLSRHYNMKIEKAIMGYPPFIKLRYKGVPVGIGLLSIGAVKTDLDEFNKHPWHERLLVAFAGPAASIIFGLLIVLLAMAMSPSDPIPPCIYERSCGITWGRLDLSISLLYEHRGLLSLFSGVGIYSLLAGFANLLIPVPPSDASKILFALIEGVIGIRVPVGLQLLIMIVVWIAAGIYFVRNFAYLVNIPLF